MTRRFVRHIQAGFALTLLAIAVGPLALVTLRRALGGRFADHRRIARITLPIWAFVAVSGWVVYVMLYVVDWGA